MGDGLDAKWSTFANDLGQLGLGILDGPPITIGPKGYGEQQPLAVMLMSRTLLNFKGVFTLVDAGLVVGVNQILGGTEANRQVALRAETREARTGGQNSEA